ncbi:MAG: type II toxin-antitoxin system HicA family toxin [Candidatus Sungbacteria bacterium]|nr:type II toxin-antitoxin system HicA family toxin [Candidatus Sungbacteria bacterium]
MPRGISNWTFRDIQAFLLQRGFTLHHVRGSHHYFKRYTNDRFFMTHVQHHGSRSIPEGTMNAIIRQSGIPKEEWVSWTEE